MSLDVIAIAEPLLARLVSPASGAVEAPVAVPFWLELIAIVVASISGALTAREHKLDLVGAVALAVLCSLGGGLLRDVTLQVGSVYLLEQPLALPAAIITATVVYIIPSFIEQQDRLIAVLDIFAVGLYSATGADKALVYGFNPMICIMMGFFTGVGGGMLRDVFLGKVPSIFQRSNFYALAAIAGGCAYMALVELGVSHVAAVVACVAVTMGTRWLSLHFNIMSPTDEDIARMMPRRKRPTEGPSARREIAGRSPDALAERRERTLASIEERREQERRSEALSRIKRIRRKRDQRRLDV